MLRVFFPNLAKWVEFKLIRHMDSTVDIKYTDILSIIPNSLFPGTAAQYGTDPYRVYR